MFLDGVLNRVPCIPSERHVLVLSTSSHTPASLFDLVKNSDRVEHFKLALAIHVVVIKRKSLSIDPTVMCKPFPPVLWLLPCFLMFLCWCDNSLP